MSVDLVGFVGVALLAYLVPGPDFLVIVRASVRRRALGRAAALGAQTGLCVHMCAAVLGLSVLATRFAYAFTVIKLLGAAYLVYLGVRAMLDARRMPRREDGPRCATDRRSSFLQGFVTNALNPKAALFFLSVLPQFVDRDGPPAGQILLLGVADIVLGIGYWLALVTVAARPRSVLERPAWRRRWERITGGLLIAIGFGVAATE
ncbi:LysE family translocator [Streptomyces sp. NPDC006668]|uniref:LysE family translocator n=1 Tax=Streptomyces sp. NPDC006668 TaxID=3156903 RepID=UPI00340437D9